MIDPIQIKIKYDNMDFFKEIPNIHFDENADIVIEKSGERWLVKAGGKPEVWVKTLEDKISLLPIPSGSLDNVIVILTTDKELLPYCMKDRLAYLQDRVNKENEHNK